MKKLLIFISIFIVLFLSTACNQNNANDALKFKKEYESLNNKKTKNGENVYRSITIRKNNPFVYKEAKDIVKMIENKESFIVYFGFPTCPWCRSVLEQLDKVSKDLKYEKIYYVNILDIRDTLELDENNKVVITKKGTHSYYKLLKMLDEVLDNYSLTDSNGKEIDTKEKRIYAPNIVAISKGKAKQLETGISKKQTDAYMKLTDEMKKETYNHFKCLINCLKKEDNICESKKSC